MSDELPPFQPSPLGLAPVTPETAKRPGRKPKAAKRGRKPKAQLSIVTDDDLRQGAAAAKQKPAKKPRQKRSVRISTASPGILDFLRLDKIANELAHLCGKDRADVLKLLAKLFK